MSESEVEERVIMPKGRNAASLEPCGCEHMELRPCCCVDLGGAAARIEPDRFDAIQELLTPAG